MYTLKIKWWRTAPSKEVSHVNEIVDETTLFIPADEVRVHSIITSDNDMTSWQEGDYQDYRVTGPDSRCEGRLINVHRNGKESWYIATNAWLMGPNGDTIERLN